MVQASAYDVVYAALSSRAAFSHLVCRFTFVRETRKEKERKRFFEDDPRAKPSIRHDPCAIIGFTSAYRPRIMSRALAYSSEDLFRHAHKYTLRRDAESHRYCGFAGNIGNTGCRRNFWIGIRDRLSIIWVQIVHSTSYDIMPKFLIGLLNIAWNW